MSEVITTYKGTDKDMKCHGGFQYELGKTYEDDGAIRCGIKGFHSCETPLDVFNYFKPIDGNRFFVSEADGKISRGDDDSKIASSKLTLKAEIGIPGLVKAQVEWTKERATTGEGANAATTGNWANAATTGEGANAATTGYNTIAAALGRYGWAKSTIGNWIVLAYYDDIGNLVSVHTAKVDGVKIKPDTWYTMKNGEIVEAE